MNHRFVIATLCGVSLGPVPGAAADWQNCAFALGTLRADIAGAQREAEMLAMLERDSDRAQRDYESCRRTGPDVNRDSCLRLRQSYDSQQMSRLSHENALRLNLSMLNQALSKVSLVCGSDVRLPLPPSGRVPDK